MKKIFTFFLALMAATSLWAIGIGDGSTKANAIDYNWDTGVMHNGAKWYCVQLDPFDELLHLHDSMQLVFVNPSNNVEQSVDFVCTMYLSGSNVGTLEETLPARQSYSSNPILGSTLYRLGSGCMFLFINSTDNIRLFITLVPGEEWVMPTDEEACVTSSLLDIETEVMQEAGDSKWYRIEQENLIDGLDLKIHFLNLASTVNQIECAISFECPDTLQNLFKTLTLAPSGRDSIVISHEYYSYMSDLYFLCTNTGNCLIEPRYTPITPTTPSTYTVTYQNGVDESVIDSETIELHIPEAPQIEGFTFIGWKADGTTFIVDQLVIVAVYEANEPTNAPAVYTNPANPSQKLVRDGNVYILRGDKTYTLTGQEVK